jgi:hypothetical protein
LKKSKKKKSSKKSKQKELLVSLPDDVDKNDKQKSAASDNDKNQKNLEELIQIEYVLIDKNTIVLDNLVESDSLAESFREKVGCWLNRMFRLIIFFYFVTNFLFPNI